MDHLEEHGDIESGVVVIGILVTALSALIRFIT